MKSKILMTMVAVMAIGSMAACTQTRTVKTAGEQVDDSAVTAKVKTALARDPSTSAYRIDVETFRGEVQLNGFVSSAVFERNKNVLIHGRGPIEWEPKFRGNHKRL